MPNVGIIDFAAAPPIGTLNPVLDHNGPYAAGNHTLTTWLDGATVRNISDSFGVLVQFSGAIPPKLGLVPGYDDGGLVVMDEFDMRLCQLVVQHQFFSGAWTVTQLEDLHVLPFTTRWQEILPGRLGLYVLPNIAVDLYFLRLL